MTHTFHYATHQNFETKAVSDPVLEAQHPLYLSVFILPPVKTAEDISKFFSFHSKTNKRSFYAVLLSNVWPPSDLSRVPTNKAKPREHSHHHHREEVHFVDEYGQPITMQAEGKKGRGHRRRRSRCAAECSGPMERQWEALRAMMEGDGGQADGYSAG